MQSVISYVTRASVWLENVAVPVLKCRSLQTRATKLGSYAQASHVPVAEHTDALRGKDRYEVLLNLATVQVPELQAGYADIISPAQACQSSLCDGLRPLFNEFKPPVPS